ncbi:Aminomethyltransferase (glycine cleavage system T protein) [Candidatus Rhodobacter oscarellae]|uniref:aminomethyltransferase n=1 Tax=Candidatus Rhodobacter oscarellae TaxID=1675527 RepID=A0A0J9E9U3_9RHOB|nr:glycine cleavage system aminomethyltransferase GcvT [Candidatus Rhodobacter lobularis]KMW59567.1 Aminomethyltransferase (glycine cleavage system T protein) [Candidatus Rhodobacter lobularis]
MGDDLRRTQLFDLHVELGAKLVPFAGYEMPVQYPMGVLKEHLHCRTQAGLFDVSHMGQVLLRPKTGVLAAGALERLVPQDLVGLKKGRQRYAFFTNESGGILDDLMVANRGDHLFLVVNAACKAADIAHMRAALPDCEIEEITDRALLALQGPGAEAVLDRIAPGTGAMRFMDVAVMASEFGALWVSRSGYTGEDGFEISVPGGAAQDLARAILQDDTVAPIGLGARDSLRLEAGLCLYGNDIDETTSPVEAGLEWAMQKARKPGGAREGGFPGADRILQELTEGAPRRRVGLRPEGRAPMRAGTEIFNENGDMIGAVTSGAFGPSIEAPMSMGYVTPQHAEIGTQVFGEVRGKRLPATITGLPFRPAGFKR